MGVWFPFRKDEDDAEYTAITRLGKKRRRKKKEVVKK